MQLLQLRLPDYRGLRDFTLDLESAVDKGQTIAVLIGPDRGGKSRILHALAELFGALYRCTLGHSGRTDFGYEVRYRLRDTTVEIVQPSAEADPLHVPWSPRGLGHGPLEEEGEELFRVTGQFCLRQSGDDVAQRHGLIDQGGVVGQEPGGHQGVELGVAERRASGECAQSGCLAADAVPEPGVAAGMSDGLPDGPGVEGDPVVIRRVGPRCDICDDGDGGGADERDVREDLVGVPLAVRWGGAGVVGAGHGGGGVEQCSVGVLEWAGVQHVLHLSVRAYAK